MEEVEQDKINSGLTTRIEGLGIADLTDHTTATSREREFDAVGASEDIQDGESDLFDNPLAGLRQSVATPIFETEDFSRELIVNSTDEV